MKITYDPEVNALTIRFREAEVTTEHVAEGIAFDYDAEGHLAAIEILDAGMLTGDNKAVRQVTFQEYSARKKR